MTKFNMNFIELITFLNGGDIDERFGNCITLHPVSMGLEIGVLTDIADRIIGWVDETVRVKNATAQRTDGGAINYRTQVEVGIAMRPSQTCGRYAQTPYMFVGCHMLILLLN